MNPELSERERAVREWSVEANSVRENLYKERIAASHIESAIDYLENHQYELNEEDFNKIIGLDYAKDVLRLHLREVEDNISSLKERRSQLQDGPTHQMWLKE